MVDTQQIERKIKMEGAEGDILTSGPYEMKLFTAKDTGYPQWITRLCKLCLSCPSSKA